MAKRSHFDKEKKKTITNFNQLSFKYCVTGAKILKSLLFWETTTKVD